MAFHGIYWGFHGMAFPVDMGCHPLTPPSPLTPTPTAAGGPHGNAEALHGAHHDVGADFAGRLGQHQTQRVRRDDEIGFVPGGPTGRPEIRNAKVRG